ncbi:fructosamine deglycase [Virgibacillus indicus]|uniref:Fructosamine deglycase n=1 Tax=Virgibacillus indicus TaxID=2024554 RepID=A0A265N5Y4_9BACI|nr:SIS domain-containing protein [Virgibacillus indicus]OZU87201.1 fructosamine deglycase [Virgibacillus indicus]
MSTEVIMNLKEQVKEALTVIEKRTVKNVFFVSCGGSFALMYMSKYVVDREAKIIDAHIYSSNEFLHRNHSKLGNDSIVILCSHSGKTPETVEAAKLAQAKGALTISLTNIIESPLAETAEIALKYEFGKEAGFTSSHSILYQITFAILKAVENNDKFEAIIKSLEQLQSVYDKALKYSEPKAKLFAELHKDEKVIYSMASGSNYGAAYSFAICSLMEQQWIHSNAIHAGEYFHGPFEILDESVPFVILLGLDETRPLEERALAFTKQYGRKITVLDAKEYDLAGINEEVKGYITPLVLNHVVRYYAEKLSIERNHPLHTRRYMGIVKY